MTETESMLRKVETTGYWCRWLSTHSHHYCLWKQCDCTCHLKGGYGGTPQGGRPRPHSFPRPDWERGLRPPGWKREDADRRKAELRSGLV